MIRFFFILYWWIILVFIAMAFLISWRSACVTLLIISANLLNRAWWEYRRTELTTHEPKIRSSTETDP
jgi:high-affinity Fe2+/Pb2+ permease